MKRPASQWRGVWRLVAAVTGATAAVLTVESAEHLLAGRFLSGGIRAGLALGSAQATMALWSGARKK